MHRLRVLRYPLGVCSSRTRRDSGGIKFSNGMRPGSAHYPRLHEVTHASHDCGRSRGLQNNLLMGIAVRPEEEAELRKPYERSGYQPMRLATELIPAVVAVIGPMEFSPFWAVLFYFSLVAFGIAHQVWRHAVVSLLLRLQYLDPFLSATNRSITE